MSLVTVLMVALLFGRDSRQCKRERWGSEGVDYGWKQTEVGMGQKTFSLVAGVLFLLISLGHLLRLVFGLSVVIQNTPIPMWASWIAFVVAGYLSYEGFRLSRTSLSRV